MADKDPAEDAGTNGNSRGVSNSPKAEDPRSRSLNAAPRRPRKRFGFKIGRHLFVEDEKPADADEISLRSEKAPCYTFTPFRFKKEPFFPYISSVADKKMSTDEFLRYFWGYPSASLRPPAEWSENRLALPEPASKPAVYIFRRPGWRPSGSGR
jgi:hypothetical protein